MEGLCVKGHSCPFWHGNPEELAQVVTQSVAQSSSQQKTQPAPATVTPLNESHFPSLGNTPKSNKIDFWAPNYGSVTQQFASVSSPQSKFSSIKTTRKKNSSQKVKKVRDDGTPWLSTGDSAASTYLKHREEAIQVALDRNRLFQRATDAFLSGNKAAAKTFSLEARRLNDILESLHSEASTKIFDERNAGLGQDRGLIDLHGLHDKEAVSQLSVFLSRAPRGSNVKVVTGTGHHSRLGYSSLESAVKDFLSERGYRFAQAQRGDGMSGMYIVYLPS
jgi:DNA-nicking Smr family endonuclease